MANWRDTHVAVAVSGGADSVALLRVLAEVKATAGGRGDLSVLHFDHRVRGEASAGDARWVGELAGELGIACQLGHADGLESTSEESLRDARRAFYRSATEAIGARYLATGHTADDQAETVLFRVLRGSGLRGLAGIQRFAPLTESCTLARPLLGVTRAEVIAYLAEIEQPYREDATNEDATYTRNWLRRQVLPLLRERFPRVDRQLAGLAEHAEDARSVVEHAASQVLAECLRAPVSAGEVRLDRQLLASRPAALVVEVLRLAWREAGWPEQAMTAACWRRLADHVRSTEPKIRESLPGGVEASFDERLAVLARRG